ncbi:FolB domain-containing protein, partial [Enterobacter cloacae]|uniref:FolB domain-containing protein n=1 Tax=Enterobacter cloacae TaxID=550 RepID=UPI003D03D632
MGKLRLTTAQALVKFLDNQYLEVDGVELKFVKGIFAIFGHGNVLGLGQALEQDSGDLVFDIEMGWDNRKSAKSDDVNDCLSYADISETVIGHVEGQRFALVERVAEEVADLLLSKFNSPWVRIKLSKPGAVARAANVG